jgi:hypothetical protein
MSLEMAHKVILPPKKNYIPQFLKQRDINSYNVCQAHNCSSFPGFFDAWFVHFYLAFTYGMEVVSPVRELMLFEPACRYA